MFMRYMLRCSILIILNLLFVNVMAQKTNAAEPRLVKELRRVYNSLGYFSPLDSAIYTYSGDRAWDTVKNDWKFDIRTAGDSRIVRDFDAQNKIAIEQYQKYDRGFWWPDKRMLFEYQNNRIVKMTYQEWASGAWENLVRYEYSYDAAGNKVVDLTMVWESSGWQNSSRQVMTYSTNGADEILHERWVQNAWEAVSGEYFTYANGKKTNRIYKLAQSGWGVYQHDVFLYNSKGNDSITLTAIADSNNSFDTTKTVFHYNKNNKQDTIIQQMLVNGADSNMYKVTQLYNQFGLLGLKNTQQWNDVTKQWYYEEGSLEYLYLYEQVNVGVNNLLAQNKPLELYPVPARTGSLNAVFWSAEVQAGQITIYSLDGKHISTEAITVVQGINKVNLDISNLHPGNYMFIIKSGLSRMNRPFTIER